MAKITKDDVLSSDLFTNAIKDAEAFLVILNEMERKIKEIAKISEKKVKSINVNDSKNHKDFYEQEAKGKKIIDEFNRIQEQRLKIEKELSKLKNDQAYRDEYKELLRLREERKKNNAEMKQEVQSNQAVSNSVEALRIQTRQLIAERNKLDLSTEDGKNKLIELNRQIDENTKKIKENVSGMEKQKMNIGNYEGAISNLFPIFGEYNERLDQLKDLLNQFGSERLKNVFRKIGFDLGDASDTASTAQSNINDVSNSIQNVGQQAQNSQRPTIGFLQNINTEGQQAEQSLQDIQEEVQQIGQEANQTDATTQNALQNITSEAQDTERALQDVQQDLEQIGTEANATGNKTEQALQNITNEARQTDRSINNVEQELSQMGQESREAGQQVEQALQGIQDQASQSSEAVENVGNGLQNNGGGGIKGFFSNIFQNFTQGAGQATQATQGLTGSLGQAGASGGQAGGLLANGANLAKIGWLAVIVALGAVVKGVIDIVAESRKAEFEIQSFTSLQGEALDEGVAKVQSISKTFGVEAKEITHAANTMSKEFGISFSDALDKVRDGFLAGSDASGEYLDSIKEYSTQIKEAGFSADEFNAILNSTTQAGIYSDKGVDAIKEFGLRIREQTKATSDAMLNAFGPEFTNKILGGVRNGTLSVKDALFEVTKAMDTMDINAQQRQTLYADVFGGAGEDAGRYIEQLYKLKGNINETIASQSEYAQSLRKTQAVEEDFSKAKQELANEFDGVGFSISKLWTQIKTFFVDGLTAVIQQFKDWQIALSELSFKRIGEEALDAVFGIGGLGDVFQTTAEKERLAKQDLADYNKELANLDTASLQKIINEWAILQRQGKLTVEEMKKFGQMYDELNKRNAKPQKLPGTGISQDAIKRQQEDAKRQQKEASDRAKQANDKAKKEAEDLLRLKLKLEKEYRDAQLKNIEDDRQRELEIEHENFKRLEAEKKTEFSKIANKNLVNSLIAELQATHLKNLEEINQKYDNAQIEREKTKFEILKALQDDYNKFLLEQAIASANDQVKLIEFDVNDTLQNNLNEAILIYEDYYSKKRALLDYEKEQEISESQKSIAEQYKVLEGTNDAHILELEMLEAQALAKRNIEAKYNQESKEQTQAYSQDIEALRLDFVEKDKELTEKLISNAQQETEAWRNAQDDKLKAQQEYYQRLNSISDAFMDRERERIAKKIELYDKEIQASKDRQTELTEIAKQGIEDANNNLAYEQRKQAELEAKKEKAQRRAKLLELGFNTLKTYTQKLENKDKNALGNTIKDISLLTAFIRTLPAFYKGTENTGKGGDIDDKGGFLSILHPEERVMTAEQNRRLGGMSNDAVVSMIEHIKLTQPRLHDMPILQPQIDKKSIKEAILEGFKNVDIPVRDVTYDKIEGILTEIVRTRDKTTINKRKIKERW